MESKFKNTKPDEEMENEEEEDEVDEIINNFRKIPKLSKFATSTNQNNFNVPLPKPKLKNYSPLDWKEYLPNQEYVGDIPVYWKGDNGPILLCLHGAGHSGMSFCALSKAMKNNYRIVSFDFRGHGFNKNNSSEDLSQATLISDTIEVIKFMNNKFPDETMIIIGHSMGGSIATKVTAEILKNEDNQEEEIYKTLSKKICGLIVIDVVEGSAIEALPFMENFVRQRPKSFGSIEDGIEYMFKSGTIKNIESARLSVPTLLEEYKDPKLGIIYKWKTDLLASQKYWTEWFSGLTRCFLSIRIPKILLLASSDRMDRELTIAQMQGKFKLALINDVGHIIHEDDAKATFNMIESFISTFKITSKLSEIKPIVGKLGTNTPSFKKYEEYKI